MLSPFPRFSQSLSVRPSAADYQVVKFFRLKKISIVLSSTPTAGGGGRREGGGAKDKTGAVGMKKGPRILHGIKRMAAVTE